MRRWLGVLAVFVASNSSANAAEQKSVYNLLYALDPNAVCQPADPTTLKIIHNKSDKDSEREGKQIKIVDNKALIAKLAEDFVLTPNSSDLLAASANQDYPSILAKRLTALTAKSGGELRSDAEQREARKKPVDLRAARFRRSLLRIFDAASLGGTRDFFVVRRTVLKEPAGLSQKSKDIFGNALDIYEGAGSLYTPFREPYIDDSMIQLYVLGADNFTIICSRPNDDDVTEIIRKLEDPQRPDGPLIYEAVLTPSLGLLSFANDASRAITKSRTFRDSGGVKTTGRF
ncbi:MAG: hypothetical protein AAFV59_17300, partial [Pseudomonadota bacterium]